MWTAWGKSVGATLICSVTGPVCAICRQPTSTHLEPGRPLAVSVVSEELAGRLVWLGGREFCEGFGEHGGGGLGLQGPFVEAVAAFAGVDGLVEVDRGEPPFGGLRYVLLDVCRLFLFGDSRVAVVALVGRLADLGDVQRRVVTRLLEIGDHHGNACPAEWLATAERTVRVHRTVEVARPFVGNAAESFAEVHEPASARFHLGPFGACVIVAPQIRQEGDSAAG